MTATIAAAISSAIIWCIAWYVLTVDLADDGELPTPLLNAAGASFVVGCIWMSAVALDQVAVIIGLSPS